jgi:RimJ/RimL family protein N-acetyltransferase
LELRLPTDDELVALAAVALGGIHPPDEMPFEVAWTDTVTVESFVEHHHGLRRDWTPDDWWLNLGVWHRGEPVGAQGVNAKAFVRDRRATTGSWLGQRFQGQGIGTEMRVAVLELAFRGLGARVAVSGAADGNVASARVSEKLGYHEAGEGFVHPRGEPIRHQKLELAREEWRPPLRVEIDGLEPCLPLFGL